MLEHDQLFCLGLDITTDKIYPLADASKKDTRSGIGVEESCANV